jgi:hypothetical protein
MLGYLFWIVFHAQHLGVPAPEREETNKPP